MTEWTTQYGGEQDYYNEEEGDFDTRHLASVPCDEKSDVNEVGKVVDLLNEFDADEIRETMLEGDDE